MTDKTRIKIAALVTAVFLAGISTVGLAAHSDDPQTIAPSAAAQPPKTIDPGVASSVRSSTSDDESDDESDSSLDEREGYDHQSQGYDDERYEERDDDD